MVLNGITLVSLTSGPALAQSAATTTMTWHATLNVPTQIVELGLTTDMTYNAIGQLTQVKQADTTTQTVPFSTSGRTRIWAYTYGTGGLLASVDGPLAGTADTTTYTYTAKGFLQTTTNPLGQVTTVTAWSPSGQPTSITDPTGLATTYVYDARGRVTAITINPGSNQTAWSMTYTAVGDLATLTEPTGATYTLTWDDARHVTKIRNNLSEFVSYTRDAMGNETGRTITASDGATKVFSKANMLDELGRLIKQVGGESRTWKYTYDRTNNLTGITDPRAKTMSFGFDAVNRLVSETERDGGVVKHAYNGKNEETTYTDPRSLGTTYVRNGFGEVIQEASPDRGTTVYDYDARGLMISKKDARGITATYAYDGAGRLISRTYPTAALNETFTYDATANGNVGTGRLTRMQDAAGTSDYAYDIQGRLRQETRTIGAYAHTISYDYDGPGHLYAIHYPSGRTIRYNYDALGRPNYVDLLRTATATAEPIVGYAPYLPFGGIQGQYLGNGLENWTTWDKEYRIDGLYVVPISGGASLIERHHPIYDGLNIGALNNDATGSAQTQTFTYDDAARLQSANGPYGGRYWTYDKAGNRTAESRLVSGVGSTDSYGYPADSNKLFGIQNGATTVRSFLYDAAGSQTSDTRAGVAYATAITDAGRIGQVSVGGSVKATYTYDGRNRLSIRQTLNGTPSGTTHLIHDAWDHVIAETDGAGHSVREYVWMGDVPVAVLDGSATPASPTLLWVHVDHLGRPEMLTDVTRGVKWRAAYEPFGTVSTIAGAASLQMRFPGQWFQLEAGLAYNWNRHYDSTTGRYTQPDPLGINRGPQARSSTNPVFNTTPGTPFYNFAFGDTADVPTAAFINSTDTGGATLLRGLENLQDSWQEALRLASSSDYGARLGARGSGRRTIRDGISVYGYARQSPLLWADPSGLIVGPMTPRPPNQVVDKCLVEDHNNAWKQCHSQCVDQNIGRGFKSDAPLLYRKCMRECLKGKGYENY